jgi:hypothetical protein
MDEAGSDTRKVNVTMPADSLEWLQERYSDATSDSMRVLMAIQAARDLDRLIGADKVIYTDSEGDSMQD